MATNSSDQLAQGKAQAEQLRQWVITKRHHVELRPFELNLLDLKPREVALRMLCTVVSPGTECANFAGIDSQVDEPGSWCAYPWVPGYAGVGEVIALGADGGNVRLGDRLIVDSGHQSHVIADLDTTCVPMRDDISLACAAAVPLLSIAQAAYQVMKPDRVGCFQTVGVWGLGIIGHAAAQIGQALGYRVIGFDPNPMRRAIAQACGVKHVLDPTDPRVQEQMKTQLETCEFDVAIDTTGRSSVTLGLPDYLRIGGQLVFLTHWRQQPPVDATEFMNKLFFKQISLMGALHAVVGRTPWVQWDVLKRSKWTMLQQQIADGTLCLDPWFDHITPEMCDSVYPRLIAQTGDTLTSAVHWQAQS